VFLITNIILYEFLQDLAAGEANTMVDGVGSGCVTPTWYSPYASQTIFNKDKISSVNNQLDLQQKTIQTITYI
jgi:hypothetical protein